MDSLVIGPLRSATLFLLSRTRGKQRTVIPMLLSPRNSSFGSIPKGSCSPYSIDLGPKVIHGSPFGRN